MSGLRVYNFREGDRSEYLANYILSGIGLVTPVPRQEDIGLDFYCQIADQEKGNLTFGSPYVLQVKSESENSIVFGNDDAKEWNEDNVAWLFKLQQPLFFGFVNKEKFEISIYNTSPIAFCYYNGSTPSVVEFRRREKANNSDIGSPQKIQLAKWEQGKGDGYKHIIDLGQPLITINNDDLYDKEVLKRKKEILRSAVEVKRQNITYYEFGLPYINWLLRVECNKPFVQAWSHFKASDKKILEHYYNALAQSFISLGMNLKNFGEKDLLNNLIPFLKKIPMTQVPNEIKRDYPEFFER
ncbi:MAG TPA: hypothetical protein PKL56_15845 [Cyclobacteriaceae bacterium]|nr:hypothetical protein [Cyclobacteriaceae bacterium]HMX88007.1 hypothetical protein [Saprospiraceae bacterium]HMX00841.1 hypothetical protein [Cyclobacteriaceae bacterium]HMY93645.1 hypothetical protein [Cyclobacteriaceae bacterium]HNA12921.1 hypothetical protein [Cyclobacteriaceae bacterium]